MHADNFISLILQSNFLPIGLIDDNKLPTYLYVGTPFHHSSLNLDIMHCIGVCDIDKRSYTYGIRYFL